MSYRDNFKQIKWSNDHIYKGRYYFCPRYINKSLVVIRDIEPYKNMVDGKLIKSRREHREFLKAYDLIELGNDKFPERKPEPLPDVRVTMSEVYEKLRNR